MSSDNHIQVSDPIDDLLHNAFNEALTGPGNQLLVTQVMAQIARRQRQRTLVLALFGFIALVICLLGAAPLFALIPELFSGLFSSTQEASANTLSLPVAAAIALALAGGWLLLEEVTG